MASTPNMYTGFWKRAGLALILASSMGSQATELHDVQLVVNDQGLSLHYETELVSGVVTLYFATTIDSPKDQWQLRGYHPIGHTQGGSFDLGLDFKTTSVAGFFQLRQPPFRPQANMVWIDPGHFLLGSPESELGRTSDEGPQHKVTIPNGFWMSVYEVTQGEFQTIMGGNPSQSFDSPRNPVDSISWFEALDYCERITQQARAQGAIPEGLEYRLPTEAEWEYACRAGSTSAYSFGDDSYDLSLYAWWEENAPGRSAEVGLLKPNAWGLYDMHGNVFEWCLTKYQAYPGGAIRHTNVDYRVVRGGAFICPDYIVRSACRLESAPANSRSWLTGFRVVLAQPVPTALGDSSR